MVRCRCAAGAGFSGGLRCNNQQNGSYLKVKVMVRGHGRILLVEDDHAALMSLRRILESAGYQVTAVADGETACQHLAQIGGGVYDVVLTDLRMNTINGLDVLRAARRLPSPPEVVLLTGYGTLGTAIEALRAGVYDYLLKPCKPEELLHTIEGAVQRRYDSALQLAALREQAHGAVSEDDRFLIEQIRYMRVGELLIDRFNRRIIFRNRLVQATPTEYELLSCLAEARGQVLRFRDIVQRVYLDAHAISDDEAQQLLKTHIHNMRHKIDPAYIVNVRGVGYRLIDPRALRHRLEE
ncbi:MAG: DNA-binding response regulator [Roseiflexus castenholzii]|nr:MAG: DNA-binding response regulator [Roseiflexus castenholzii]